MVNEVKESLSYSTSKLLFIATAVFAIATLVIGKTPLMDHSGALLVCAFTALLALALRYSPIELKPHVLAIAWFAIVFFLPRLFTFATFPPQTLGAIGLEHLTPDQVTKGMAFVTIGTMALLFGLWIGNLPFSKKPLLNEKPSRLKSLPLGPILLYWIAALAASYYISIVLEISIFGPPENWGSRSGWLMRIFDTDVALLLLLVWTAVQLTRSKPNYWLIAGLLIIWLFVSMYLGSRGGPLRILFLLGLASIALHGDPRVGLRRLILIVSLTFVANALVYPLSSAIRYGIGGVENAGEQLVADWQRNPHPPSYDPVQFTPVQRILWNNQTIIHGARLVTPITTRLGVIDYPLIIVNRPPDQEVIDRYLSLGYALRNYANNMVPGELFPDNDVMTSRVFTMAYRGATESHIRQAFLSEPWTSWGYAWIKGGAIGGLFILAALAAVSQFGYRLMGQILPSAVAPYVLTTWLFVGSLNGPLQLFGIDHWLTVASHVFMALTVAGVLGWITSRSLGKLGLTSAFWVLQSHRARKSPANSESMASQDGTS
ncbi:hypothetical protein [Roseicyclus marinus]|uniref:hypothetical protein n=1 Tax=Roseicyclus marinus TaxID=2161673 RepID=UPI0030C740C7